MGVEGSTLSKIKIKFTSPGDDFEEGKATKYELRFVNSKTLNGSKIDFDDAIPILEDDLISGSLDNPLNASQVVKLEFESTKMNETNTVYFLLVRAVDEANNAGEKSNQVRFCNECETPTPAPTTEPPTTEPQTQETTSEETTTMPSNAQMVTGSLISTICVLLAMNFH